MSLVCSVCTIIVARSMLVDVAVDSVGYANVCKFSSVGLYNKYTGAVATIDSDGDWGVKINGTETLGTGSGTFKLGLFGAFNMVSDNFDRNSLITVMAKGTLNISDFNIVSQCIGCPSTQAALDAVEKKSDK